MFSRFARSWKCQRIFTNTLWIPFHLDVKAPKIENLKAPKEMFQWPLSLESLDGWGSQLQWTDLQFACIPIRSFADVLDISYVVLLGAKGLTKVISFWKLDQQWLTDMAVGTLYPLLIVLHKTDG